MFIAPVPQRGPAPKDLVPKELHSSCKTWAILLTWSAIFQSFMIRVKADDEDPKRMGCKARWWWWWWWRSINHSLFFPNHLRQQHSLRKYSQRFLMIKMGDTKKRRTHVLIIDICIFCTFKDWDICLFCFKPWVFSPRRPLACSPLCERWRAGPGVEASFSFLGFKWAQNKEKRTLNWFSIYKHFFCKIGKTRKILDQKKVKTETYFDWFKCGCTEG